MEIGIYISQKHIWYIISSLPGKLTNNNISEEKM